jgi:uncharacterized delta-60 repeat protein
MAIFLLTVPVALYAQDYSLDPSFGTNGKVWDPVGPYESSEYYYEMAPRVLVTADGKILHISNTREGTMITRYLPDGTIDSTFGNTVPNYYYGTFGKGSVQYLYTGSLQSLTVMRAALGLPDGKFLMAGYLLLNTDRVFGLMRYGADGSPDQTFYGQGWPVRTSVGSGNAEATAMALQADGKIVLAGTAVVNGVKVFATVRYNPDGTLDNSFDGDGIAYTDYNGRDATATAVAVQTDGKIVVAGDVQNLVYHDRFGYPTGPQYQYDAGLVRLNPDGTMDASFGTNGRGTLPTFDGAEHVRCMALQPDGKIVIAGDLQYFFTIFFTMRFGADGAPDTSFGTTGEQQFNFGFDGGFSQDIGILEDGTILYTVNDAATWPPNDIQLFRVPPGGQLAYVTRYSYQEGSGNGSLVSVDVGGYLAQQGAKIIIGGLTTYRPSGQSMGLTKPFLVRINSTARLISRNPVLYYRDGDGDGYGDNSVTTVSFTTPTGYVTRGGDCNDSDTSVYPGAVETDDRKDNDCNGIVDDVIRYTPIPAKIEAEAYYKQSGTQVEGTTDVGSGQNVGYIDWGDWIDYNLAVPDSGEYQVFLRLASPSVNSPRFEMRLGEEVLAVVDVPNTGGFQDWQTVRVPITLPQGDQRVRIVSTGGGYWNLNWLQFKTDTIAPDHYVLIPARLEAEAYASQSGTQVEGTTDTGGGENVGYLDWGDWMEYPITVPVTGTYYVWFRIATPSVTHPQFVVKSDNTVLAVVDVPYTGGFQQWQTLGIPIPLQQGEQIIRIVSTGGGYWNINWLQFGYATPLTKAQGVREKEDNRLTSLLQGTNVYPNPVRSSLTLEVNGEHTGPVNVDVVDGSGKVVKRFVLNKQGYGLKTMLPLSGLSPGAYFIRITVQGQSVLKKVVKE